MSSEQEMIVNGGTVSNSYVVVHKQIHNLHISD